MKIFISYAREDIAAARQICASLQRLKIEPWLDVEKILPGQNWRDAIDAAIRESSFFLALFSSHSVTKRGFVQKELKVALEVAGEMPPSQIYIIPLRIDDCKPEYPALRDIQWVDLFPSYDIAIDKILDVLLPGRRGKPRESEAITSLAFVGHGEQLLVQHADGALELWDAATTSKVAQVADKVSSVAVSPRRDKIIYCSEARITVAELKTTDVLTTFKATKEVTSLGFSHDSKTIVVGSGDGTLAVWDIWGRKCGRLSGGFVGDRYGALEGPNKVRFSPDDRHIVSLSTYGNRIKIWSAKSGELMQEQAGYDRIEDFAISPEGGRLAFVDVEDDINYNSTLKIIGFPKGAEIRSFYDSYLLQALDFSPDGKYLAAGTNDRKGVIRIYDTGSDREWSPHQDAAIKRLLGYEEEIYAVAYSPDGRRVASGDSRGMVTIWAT